MAREKALAATAKRNDDLAVLEVKRGELEAVYEVWKTEKTRLDDAIAKAAPDAKAGLQSELSTHMGKKQTLSDAYDEGAKKYEDLKDANAKEEERLR